MKKHKLLIPVGVIVLVSVLGLVILRRYCHIMRSQSGNAVLATSQFVCLNADGTIEKKRTITAADILAGRTMGYRVRFFDFPENNIVNISIEYIPPLEPQEGLGSITSGKLTHRTRPNETNDDVFLLVHKRNFHRSKVLMAGLWNVTLSNNDKVLREDFFHVTEK